MNIEFESVEYRFVVKGRPYTVEYWPYQGTIGVLISRDGEELATYTTPNKGDRWDAEGLLKGFLTPKKSKF